LFARRELRPAAGVSRRVGSWVEGQLSQNSAVVGDDSKGRTGNQEGDWAAGRLAGAQLN